MFKLYVVFISNFENVGYEVVVFKNKVFNDCINLMVRVFYVWYRDICDFFKYGWEDDIGKIFD